MGLKLRNLSVEPGWVKSGDGNDFLRYMDNSGDERSPVTGSSAADTDSDKAI
jgi:hypothetical protein